MLFNKWFLQNSRIHLGLQQYLCQIKKFITQTIMCVQKFDSQKSFNLHTNMCQI